MAMLHCVCIPLFTLRGEDVDREREFNTCWEQSMMGGVSEVTVSIDGRMEPARTRGDGSPMLPQSHEQFRSGTSKSWYSSSGSKHGKRIEKASSAHFPSCFRRRKGGVVRPAMRGKRRSTQLEMAKRAQRKNVPIFCPTYRSKLDGRAADSVTELLHLSERDVSKKCAAPHRCCLMDTRSIIRACLSFSLQRWTRTDCELLCAVTASLQVTQNDLLCNSGRMSHWLV